MSLSRFAVTVMSLAILFPVAVAAAEETGYEHREDFVFAEVHGVGLQMDIFTPKKNKNGLAVIDVASGSYFSDKGKVRQQEKFGVFEEFCSKGYTVFAIRPGSMTKFSIPEMADHIKLGIRWVRMHGDEFGITADNLNRVGIVGASAGGHLASLVATTPDDGSPNAKDKIHRYSCRTQALIAFFPPTDFLAFGNTKVDTDKAPGVPAMFKGIMFPGPPVPRTPEQLKAQMIKISPAHQIQSDCPPVLLIHGDADPTVPLQQSQVFHDRLKEKGIDVTFIIKPGGGHPWPTLRDEVKIAVDWMDGKLRGKAIAKGGG